MWRHITGVEQPAKKIKLDNNEKLEYEWLIMIFNYVIKINEVETIIDNWKF
jgi:hypothetical protein